MIWLIEHIIFIRGFDPYDEYYTTYKLTKLTCISFMFIEINFIHYYYCVMFAMNSMSICIE